jgi:hypothetical protein
MCLEARKKTTKSLMISGVPTDIRVIIVIIIIIMGAGVA